MASDDLHNAKRLLYCITATGSDIDTNVRLGREPPFHNLVQQALPAAHARVHAYLIGSEEKKTKKNPEEGECSSAQTESSRVVCVDKVHVPSERVKRSAVLLWADQCEERSASYTCIPFLSDLDALTRHSTIHSLALPRRS